MILNFLALASFVGSQLVLAATCPEIAPQGYYTQPGNVFNPGAPPSNIMYSFALQPSFLTQCELQQLHTMCVERINQYRAGQLVFSNGQADPTLGNPPPLQATPALDKCSSESALGDFYLMNPYCNSGAHVNALACQGYILPIGQNMCCPRPVFSFQDVQNQLYGCLQQMWDEGMNGGGVAGSNGHYLNMKDPGLLYASCGFAFSIGDTQSVVMTQNFGAGYDGHPTINTLAPTLNTPKTTLRPTATPTLTLSVQPGKTHPPVVKRKKPTKKKRKHRGLLQASFEQF